MSEFTNKLNKCPCCGCKPKLKLSYSDGYVNAVVVCKKLLHPPHIKVVTKDNDARIAVNKVVSIYNYYANVYENEKSMITSKLLKYENYKGSVFFNEYDNSFYGYVLDDEYPMRYFGKSLIDLSNNFSKTVNSVKLKHFIDKNAYNMMLGLGVFCVLLYISLISILS